MTAIKLHKCESQADLKCFQDYPFEHYRGHPHWVPPLRFELRKKYNLKKNPFFKHASASFWLAYDGTRCVGRIAAFINDLHLEKYQDDCGHFGCFESQSQEVAFLLLGTAKAWLKEHGLKKMIGPYDFSINEISGLLIDAFDQDPSFMMPYNSPDYPKWFDAYGLRKEKDLFAYEIDCRQPLPKKLEFFIKKSKQMFSAEIRHLSHTNFTQEVTQGLYLFNRAWEKNWGSLPLTDLEIQQTVGEFKQVLKTDMCVGAFLGDTLVGILCAIPNLNKLIKSYQGYLFPFNFFHFLYHFRMSKLTSFRFVLGGVDRQFIESNFSGLLFIQMIDQLLKVRLKYPHIHTVELSWVLEDNVDLIGFLKLSGATHSKTYRLYSHSFE